MEQYEKSSKAMLNCRIMKLHVGILEVINGSKQKNLVNVEQMKKNFAISFI